MRLFDEVKTPVLALGIFVIFVCVPKALCRHLSRGYRKELSELQNAAKKLKKR